MTRRRRTVLAIAATAAVLITAGLGARRDEQDEPSDDRCGELGEWTEFCAYDCENVVQEFADACRAECMMISCRDQLPYPKQDPIWSAPCDDMRGVPFWENVGRAQTRCKQRFHWDLKDWPAFEQCSQAEAEQHCPELTGTDWWNEYREALAVDRP